ncbi:MAG: Mov34/MPN/PAD-1 family protein [Chloroflexota bacterium]|jgi:proteasome lid subunit RPN8/RPN11
MTEQSWVLLGAYHEQEGIWRLRACRHVPGQPASVEADWQWALAREEVHGDVVGFAHTHPAGSGTEPSNRDLRTMEAWCSAFGKPLVCLIAEGHSLHDPAGYLFHHDGDDPLSLAAFELELEKNVTQDKGDYD